jgi:FkbM family methyltransferase
MKMLVPRSGSAALTYYQGFSEPETADFILGFLKPGMVFLDVGAHVGEFVLLASRQVGPSGQVHAFEPQPDTFAVLQDNVALNDLHNVWVTPVAAWKSTGECDFAVCREPADSHLLTGASQPKSRGVKTVIRVPTCTLDEYCSRQACRPHLVKVDAEGAELPILQGAVSLLRLPPGRAPALILEFAPLTSSRFHYGLPTLCDFLQTHGYHLHALTADAWLRPPAIAASEPIGTVNLLASKS